MIDLVEPSVTPPAVRRRRVSRRIWICLALVLVVAAGVITAVSIWLRYLHAPVLSTDGGGWLPPNNNHLVTVQAGQYSASIAAPRPGHAQTFELDLDNDSSVSQTVLGLTDAAYLGSRRQSAEPEHIAVSTGAIFPQTSVIHYTSRPVTIPPGGQYSIRVTQDTANVWDHCRSEYWDQISLQVRVGFFTRTEVVQFGNLIMQLQDLRPSCHETIIGAKAGG